jgi:polar amino acid transport system substrate-binding protein
MNKSRNFKTLAVVVPALAISLAAGSAHADRLADIKAKGALTCATLTTSEPLGFSDPVSRKTVGFDVDMCEAVAKRLGVKMEHKGVSVEARVPELTLGRVDIVSAALGYTKERATQIDYTNVHYQTAIKLIVKTNSGLDKIQDLADKKISANKGSTPELFARRVLPNATILTFQDTPAAFLALAQSKVQGLALSQPSGIRFVNETSGEYKFASGELSWEATALGIKKDEPALLAAVNTALEGMEKDGEIDALWTKWFGPSTKFNITREKKLTPISAFQS